MSESEREQFSLQKLKAEAERAEAQTQSALAEAEEVRPVGEGSPEVLRFHDLRVRWPQHRIANPRIYDAPWQVLPRAAASGRAPGW